MPVVSYAADSDELIRLLAHLQRARADFLETVTDAQGHIIQQTKGHMILQRPGRFRWEIQQPNRQLLVADGQHIWFYDVDLQQVVVQKQQAMVANSPAALLSDSTLHFTQQFRIKRLANNQEFQLIPKDENALFSSIILVFQGDRLYQMRLLDKLSQQTDIRFSHFIENPSLNAQSFRFVLPKNKNIEIVKG